MVFRMYIPRDSIPLGIILPRPDFLIGELRQWTYDSGCVFVD